MTTQTDFLTAAKNIVTAINDAAQTYLNVQGAVTVSNITAPTVLKLTPGRVARVSVTTEGNATGTIYDSAATTVTTRPIYVIPTTIGVTEVNLPTSYGILVVPGTGNQTVSVSYS